MAGVAGTTLLWRGTFVDQIWTLNPNAHRQLAPMGRIVGVAFLVLAVALGVAAVGWFLQRLWGWRLAIAIITIQLVADLLNLLRGDFVRGPVGILVAGALLIYLLRRDVKTVFLARSV
jgi:small-conductance mechanosensitive channel